MTLTTNKLLRAGKHYLAGFLAAAWNGGISGVSGILGIDSVAMTSASSTDVRILNLHEMLAAFGGAFVIHGIFWLKSHPVPEKFSTNAPFFPKPKNPGANPPQLPNS